MDDAEIAVVGTKGQIVIPQGMRKQLAISPKTKLAIYRQDNKLVITKLNLPSVSEDFDALLKEIDDQNHGTKAVSDREVLREIQEYRKERKTKEG